MTQERRFTVELEIKFVIKDQEPNSEISTARFTQDWENMRRDGLAAVQTRVTEGTGGLITLLNQLGVDRAKAEGFTEQLKALSIE
jgi:hypothetical protein